MFSFLFWFGGLSVRSENVLHKVMNVCGKVVGRKQETLSQLYECHVVQKTRMIVDDRSHVLSQYCDILASGCQFLAYLHLGTIFRLHQIKTKFCVIVSSATQLIHSSHMCV